MLTGQGDIDLMTVPKLPKNVVKNVPNIGKRGRYTNVTCKGLTRQEARRAFPNSLVERPRSGIKCFLNPRVALFLGSTPLMHLARSPPPIPFFGRAVESHALCVIRFLAKKTLSLNTSKANTIFRFRQARRPQQKTTIFFYS